jgi:Bacterial transcriptional activator domain
VRHPPRVRKLYVVQPPKGRHHESLWEIAERHLGDGRRYPEIFRLNQGREQPDGDRLTLASLIRPGWVLLMPPDAVGVQVVHEPATGGAARARGAGRDAGEGAGEGAAGDARQGAALAEREPAGGGRQAEREGASGPRLAGRDAADGARQAGREAGRRQEPSALPAAELAGAMLLAAGLLAALGRRRRQQLWHRAFGRRIRLPAGDGAAAEEAIRIGADPAAARLLDLGLRSLSRTLRQAGRTLPTVYGARLVDGGIELALAPAEPRAPAPWTAAADGAIWRLPASAAADLDERALRDVLAPYPGLVSLGRDHSGWVLVDLEAAYGVVSVLGPPERCQEVLAAMAAELATNRWSDHMGVTLVGFGEDLALLAPERVRAVATLEEVLPELEARAEETRQALAAAGVDSVLTGRCRGIAGEAWMPHFVLVARQPAAADRERLLRLSGVWQRTPTGYLVAGDLPGAAWTLHVDDDGRASLPLLGLEVDAQRLPAAQYRAVVELFRAATDLAAEPRPRPPGSPGAALGAADLERPAAVEVRLLGPVEVRAPGALEEGRAEACTEALVYLATHPDGVHPTVLGGAVWPRGVSAAVRDATVARLRDWLGRDAAGRPNLVTGSDGRLRLGPEVRSDWAVFQALLRLAEADPAGEPDRLQQALSLVRGPLLAGRRPRRYAWLAREDLEHEVPARIADAAHRLVELRLAGSDARGAAAAARAGLRGAPDEEGLWRDLLRATHATGDTARLRAVVGELEERVAADPALEELHAETEALIDELLPSWRLSLAT